MANDHSFSQKLSCAFNRCFGVVFGAVCFLIITAGFFIYALVDELTMAYYSAAATVFRYMVLLVGTVAVAALLTALYRQLQTDRFARLDERKINTTVIFCGVGIILAVQLACGYFFRMEPVTDISYVEVYARQIVKSGSFSCIGDGSYGHYIIKYQNNLAYLLILTAVYKVTYLLTGTFSHAPIIVINTLALNAAVLMTVLTARRVFGNRKAIYTLALCALFSPFFTYTAYFYTDSLSIPFAAGTIYTFTVALQSEKRAKKAALLILSGVLCCVGFKIKGSVGILLAAAVIYLFLQYGFKRALKSAAAVLLGFTIVFGSFAAAMKATNLIPKEMSDRYQFPATHWVMMGLNEQGAFSNEDRNYTESFETKAEKQQANLDEIGRRLKKNGVFKTILNTGIKGVWTWMDGTFYIGYYLRDYRERTPLHSFVLLDGSLHLPYYAYCAGFRFFLLLTAAYSGFAARKKRKTDITSFFRIAVFGLFLFLLIWEAAPRYPFNFSPLFLLLATAGAGSFSARLSAWRDKLRRHDTRKKEASQIN